MLTMLPDEFTFEDYLNVRQSLGKQGDGRGTIRIWVHRGYIVLDDTTKRYVKKK